MNIFKIAMKTLLAPLVVLCLGLLIWVFMISAEWAIGQAVSGSALYASAVALGWIFIVSFAIGLVRHFVYSKVVITHKAKPDKT